MTSAILDLSVPAHSLRPEVSELRALLAASQSVLPVPQEDISRGETRTPEGLALSPAMAAMCADDFVRTVQFIRGTRAAILEVRRAFPDRPARVLYAGCGPFATLAVPLMAAFSSAEAVFTLIDIHPESTASARSVIGSLGLSGSTAVIDTMDAVSYRVDPAQPPDVILIEMIRACLESEPQVAVTRHLVRQARSAIVVPEEVRIELALVDPSREFDLSAVAQGREPAKRDRIQVGTVFVLSRKTADSWPDDLNARLPAASVQIPEEPGDRYQAMLFTAIRTFRDILLSDYDSGLTSPRVLSTDGAVGPRSRIDFHYILGSNPRLIGEVRMPLND